jgi:5-deoxy-glucuronate isomerase
MNRDPEQPLLCKPQQSPVYQSIRAKEVPWNLLNFEAKAMRESEIWTGFTGDNEYGIILLGGNYRVSSDKGTWETVNGRKDVFSGIAHSLYLPRHTEFKLEAVGGPLDIAYGWCATDQDFPARFKRPDEVEIEIRGGDNATRQINDLLGPGFGCHRLVSVEVYTPSGNWSSFPAHKHDERKTAADGTLLEAELVETYFYKIDRSEGFAIQHVYTSDGELDALNYARNNDVVLVPRGYHPVVAGHGYNVYYLNFLAGSDQSLANTPDPAHTWIFDSWSGKDPRIPMVTAEMNG